MFTNLANYLLGTITNQQQDPTTTGVQQQQQQQTNLRLTSGDDDGDWVLVDRDSEGNSSRSSSEYGDYNDDEDDEQRDLFIPRIRTRTSSSSSLPCATMEVNLVGKKMLELNRNVRCSQSCYSSDTRYGDQVPPPPLFCLYSRNNFEILI